MPNVKVPFFFTCNNADVIGFAAHGTAKPIALRH
nr:hypothetical protein WMHIBSEC_WMHIBSEC_CDS_0029 [Caudoviricetes sp.]CAI9751724.1 hypothetical protein AZFZUZMX_AZFZUZMX_CDS_0029 [Caudoviricetes sp.]